jgi:hypothetical protein
VWRQGYCQAHFKRYQRGGPAAVGGPINDGLPPGATLSPKQKTVEAFIALVDCDSENDDLYTFLEERAIRAAERWLQSRGWSPPAPAPKPRRAHRRRPLPRPPIGPEQLEIWPSQFWSV